jgi:hypothetical protein
MIRFRPNGNVVCLKLLQLIVFLLIPIFSFAAVSGANGFVEVSTSCTDVLSIKGIDKDFHLLVTNASV